MPRPKRCRRICSRPAVISFVPEEFGNTETVVLMLDEYEAIRQMDWEHRTHEQCAQMMDISRTTVTEIYESARRKIADFLVNGKSLAIGGGNCRVCAGREECFAGCGSSRVCTGAQPGGSKGENIMRAAVAYDNGNVFQHFGHTENFKVYDIEEGEVKSSSVIGSGGQGHGALAGMFAANKVDVLICGGIGGGAQAALAEAGIKLYAGVSGSADEAVASLIAGKLNFDPEARCAGHGHEGGHSCHGREGNCEDHSHEGGHSCQGREGNCKDHGHEGGHGCHGHGGGCGGHGHGHRR